MYCKLEAAMERQRFQGYGKGFIILRDVPGVHVAAARISMVPRHGLIEHVGAFYPI